MGEPLRVALQGAGNISAQYLASLVRLPNLELVAVCDVDEAAAQRAAESYPGAVVAGIEDTLADDSIDAVLNLTPPALHPSTTIAALDAGKHVYVEKPFATTLADADAMLAAAQRSGRRLGVAPDTVLGKGVQTSRQILDSGSIGRPLAATAFMMSAGHESWHPNPGFYYRAGGGPLLDMGVYYLTTLVLLLGPIESVWGVGARPRHERVVPPQGPLAGEVLPVEVDTFVTAILRHPDGVVSTLTVTFDALSSKLPPIEIYGERGTLAVPDPNRFDDPVAVASDIKGAFQPVPFTAGYRDAGRGYGLSDLARSIGEGVAHRQSAELGYHVNEVMLRITESAQSGQQVAVRSRCERPRPVPLDALPSDA